MAPNEGLRTAKYPSGIASIAVGDIERQVPVDEPPPLRVNAQLSVIGKPVPRINGRSKVTGAARFTVDVKLPGMLYGRLLRSPHPHARIASIDTSGAERLAGVRAVHLITETVGGAVEADPAAGSQSQMPRALYVGAPVAAVAALTPEGAEAALQRINVQYEVLPFVVDMEEARRTDAPRVFEGPVKGESFGGGTATGDGVPQQGNVRGPAKAGIRGNVEQGLAQAAVVAEGEFRTQVQTHCCLETHAVVADWRADGLTVYMSTQYTAGVRNELARVFGLPHSRVRVVVDAIGGRVRLEVVGRQLCARGSGAIASRTSPGAPGAGSPRGATRQRKPAPDLPAPAHRGAP